MLVSIRLLYKGILFAVGVRVKGLVVLLGLAILLTGLTLFGPSDTVISVADTTIADSELSSSVGGSDDSGSASATITITMYAVAYE